MDEAEGALRMRDAMARITRAIGDFTAALRRTQQSMEATQERVDALRAQHEHERDLAPRAALYIRDQIDAHERAAGRALEVAEVGVDLRGDYVRYNSAADERAHAAARALLEEHLTPEQRTQLAQDGGFVVVSQGGRTYQLGFDHVVALDGPLRGTYFCIQLYYYPIGDAVLARKLLLETDEWAFLTTAGGGAWSARLEIADDLAAKGLLPVVPQLAPARMLHQGAEFQVEYPPAEFRFEYPPGEYE